MTPATTSATYRRSIGHVAWVDEKAETLIGVHRPSPERGYQVREGHTGDARRDFDFDTDFDTDFDFDEEGKEPSPSDVGHP
jgi:hypothetical protein